jgi:nucleoside phosphorylase
MRIEKGGVMADKPRTRSQIRALFVALLVVVLGCGSSDDDGCAAPTPVLPLLVLGAFPGEAAPLLAETTVNETVEVDGRTFWVGVLGDTPVVLGITGIGLMNAAATARAALDHFEVAGLVMSAVAGTALQVGDVAVPTTWQLPDGRVYPTHRPWRDLAAEAVASGAVSMDRCTLRPADPSAEPVCLPFEPVVGFGGYGRSDDPFGDTPFACQPDVEAYPDVFGCEVVAASPDPESDFRPATVVTVASGTLNGEDMETAEVARAAAARGLPFIAFRAASDGRGDPLGLPGFPAQFFVYYRLAARNAAAVTVAFLERLAAGAAAGESHGR